MSRHRVLLLALMSLSALAALAACSSSGSSSSASGTASSSTPSVRVGLLTEWFDTPLPSDQAQAAVVEDFRQGLILYDKSQENFGLVSPVTSWVTGSALTDLKQTLSTLEKNELVPAGVDRLFRTSVTALSGSAATITTCDDGSKYNEQNPRTHAISPSSWHLPLNQEYIFITWGMTRAGGHWAIESITIASSSSATAKSCLP
jgi:hypothetical protein